MWIFQPGLRDVKLFRWILGNHVLWESSEGGQSYAEGVGGVGLPTKQVLGQKF